MVDTATGPPETEGPETALTRPQLALRDWIAGGSLFAATAAVILWQNAHVAVLWDLGYVLDSAARIAAGQVPYRDFPFAHAPLTFLMQAAIIRLTGRVYFHHVLYCAAVGGAATVLTWRIALGILRGHVHAAWTLALLLAIPLVALGIYCVFPFPSYDCDCSFWILVAIAALLRVDSGLLRRVGSINARSRLKDFPQGLKPGCLEASYGSAKAEPLQNLIYATNSSGKNKNAARAVHPRGKWRGGFAAGVLLCVPVFSKQNMGLPFLAAAVGVVVVVVAVRWVKGGKNLRPPAGVLAGVGGALLAAALLLESITGLGNYLHWTIGFAAHRRLPALDAMMGVYLYPALAWQLPCATIAILLLCTRTAKKLWAQIAAFALLAAPFMLTLASLFVYDDADERGDALLELWPLLLVLAAALALVRVIRERRALSLRSFLSFLLLAAINGTLMSQQLWGSTYAIWPLLVLLLAEMVVFVDERCVAGGARWFAPAMATLLSATLLVCGGFYSASEERLSYAQFPEGHAIHSAFPQLAGMATPGPYLPEFDELLRYVANNIPASDGVILLPGEEPFFFATGRTPQFPITLFDPTTDPYPPDETATLVRTKGIRWMIVKRDLQIREDPTPQRAELMQALLREFTLAARLRGYDVYRR